MRVSGGRGFTLIELMVTLAVLAIILAIAIPAFNEQVRKGRRSEAISQLQNWQLRLEQWRTTNPTYANPTASPNYPGAPLNTSYYTYTLVGAGATGFQLNAVPIGGQASDRAGSTPCNPMRIQVNAGVAIKTPEACWR